MSKTPLTLIAALTNLLLAPDASRAGTANRRGWLPVEPLLTIVLDYASPFVGWVQELRGEIPHGVRRLAWSEYSSARDGSGAGGDDGSGDGDLVCASYKEVYRITTNTNTKAGTEAARKVVRFPSPPDAPLLPALYVAIVPDPLRRGSYYAATDVAVWHVNSDGTRTHVVNSVMSRSDVPAYLRSAVRDILIEANGKTLWMLDAGNAVSVDLTEPTATAATSGGGDGKPPARKGVVRCQIGTRPHCMCWDRIDPAKAGTAAGGMYVTLDSCSVRHIVFHGTNNDSRTERTIVITNRIATKDGDLLIPKPSGIVSAPGTSWLVFCCTQSHAVYTLDTRTGVCERLAGTAGAEGAANGDALNYASFCDPAGPLLHDHARLLYFVDTSSRRLRSLTLPPHLFPLRHCDCCL